MSTITRGGKPPSSKSRVGPPFSIFNTPRLPTLRLPPSNPVFSIVLLLASGSRSFSPSFYVYYGHRRHCQFCFPFHAPCIRILLFIRHTHTKHQSAHIHQQSTHIYAHCFRVHILPRARRVSQVLLSKNDGVFQRLTPVSLDSRGTPGLDISSIPSDVFFPPFLSPPLFLVSFLFHCDLWSVSCPVFRSLHILYNVYLFWTYDTPHIFSLSSPSPCPCRSL